MKIWFTYEQLSYHDPRQPLCAAKLELEQTLLSLRRIGEAFVKTLKRDYARLSIYWMPDVMAFRPTWFEE